MTVINNNKPTILILSCLGGSGHESARKTIQDDLGSYFNFQVYYPFKDLLISKFVDAENFYNGMVMLGQNRVINYLASWTPYILTSCFESKITRKMERLIENMKPACVISVAPIINIFSIKVCAQHNIPYCLVTLDADLTNWAIKLKQIAHLSKRLTVTIGNELETTRGTFLKENIPNKQIKRIGFPIRKEFFAPKASEQILCDQLGVPYKKPKIMIMMGGSASTRISEITKILFQKRLFAHFIVVAGNNNQLGIKTKKLPIHPTNSLTVLGSHLTQK